MLWTEKIHHNRYSAVKRDSTDTSWDIGASLASEWTKEGMILNDKFRQWNLWDCVFLSTVVAILRSCLWNCFHIIDITDENNCIVTIWSQKMNISKEEVLMLDKKLGLSRWNLGIKILEIAYIKYLSQVSDTKYFLQKCEWWNTLITALTDVGKIINDLVGKQFNVIEYYLTNTYLQKGFWNYLKVLKGQEDFSISWVVSSSVLTIKTINRLRDLWFDIDQMVEKVLLENNWDISLLPARDYKLYKELTTYTDEKWNMQRFCYNIMDVNGKEASILFNHKYSFVVFQNENREIFFQVIDPFDPQNNTYVFPAMDMVRVFPHIQFFDFWYNLWKLII